MSAPSFSYLGSAGAAGAVEADVLCAQQIVTRGDAARDLDADGLQSVRRPREAGRCNGGVLLVDLKPHRAVAGEGLGRLPRWRLRHVELQRPRVLDAAVDAEPDRVARVDVLGPRAVGSGH